MRFGKPAYLLDHPVGAAVCGELYGYYTRIGKRENTVLAYARRHIVHVLHVLGYHLGET